MSDGVKDFDPRRVVVIDTSPLFNALALMYVRNSPIQRNSLKRTLPDYLRNDPAKETDFLQLFSSIRTLVTTSHVVGEIQGVLKTSGLHPKAKELWDFSMTQLNMKGLIEHTITLLGMHQSKEMKELVCAIGPTDAGLIALAREKRAILLTDDERTLAHYAFQMPGIECKLVKFIL